jgi:hypothetical protein
MFFIIYVLEDDIEWKWSGKKSTVHIMINQKQMDSVEYFSYLGSLITRVGRCAPKIKSRIL